jgi:hypothetical protein
MQSQEGFPSIGPAAERFRGRAAFLVVAALGLGESTLAQDPRPGVQVSFPPQDADVPGVAVDGDLAAICWVDSAANAVLVATSDGRGLAWSAPVRVDLDPSTSKYVSPRESVHVSGDAVFVVYEESHPSPYDPPGIVWSVRSTDRGATFSAPLKVDLGAQELYGWAVATARVGGVDHIYVLGRTCVSCSPSWLLNTLVFCSSLDGGASFGAAKGIGGGCGGIGPIDVDAFDVAATGNAVHVVVEDNSSGLNTVYYRRSADSGATFSPCGFELGDHPGVEETQGQLRVVALGDTVAVKWNEEPSGSGNDVVQANVSTDGGVTFGGAHPVGATPAGFDASEGDVAIDADTGRVLIAFLDDRTGVDEAYAATSLDGGASWIAETRLSNGGAQPPLLVTGKRTAATTWVRSHDFITDAQARESEDGGLTWGPLLSISDNAGGGGNLVLPAAYAAAYRNYVFAWREPAGPTYDVIAGGFRPQTLTPVGWAAGPTSAGFAFERFNPAVPQAGVLLSGSPGSLAVPFGDGREVGLLPDAVLSASIRLLYGPLGAALDAIGAGATPLSPVSLPPGLTVWAVGYQVSIALGVVQFGDLSDAVSITL